jgi:hypothetical protein
LDGAFCLLEGKMRKNINEIITDEQLQNCVLANINVQIWFDEEYDESVILEFDNEIIKGANNFYYLREKCRLVTFYNYFKLIK